MSPTALATLRRIERDTRRLAQPYPGWDEWRAPMPVTDFYRPAALLHRWRGPGRFFYR